MHLSRDDFRLACARFATGVCVLTTCLPDGSPHGLTVNSFNSLSLEPPLVIAAVACSSTQLDAFEKADYFAVNILTEAQEQLAVHFARRQDGRFGSIEWRLGSTGAPVFADILGAIECRTVQRFDAGDHRVLVGEAVAAAVYEGRPLLYFQSKYAALG